MSNLLCVLSKFNFYYGLGLGLRNGKILYSPNEFFFSFFLKALLI